MACCWKYHETADAYITNQPAKRISKPSIVLWQFHWLCSERLLRSRSQSSSEKFPMHSMLYRHLPLALSPAKTCQSRALDADKRRGEVVQSRLIRATSLLNLKSKAIPVSLRRPNFRKDLGRHPNAEVFQQGVAVNHQEFVNVSSPGCGKSPGMHLLEESI